MKRYYFILYSFHLILIFILLQGCTSAHPKRYFQLYMLPGQDMNLPKIDKTILVKTIETDSAYDDYRIVYKISPYELNYYSYEFWIKNPGGVIQDAIADFLSRENAFTKVSKLFSEINPDFLLEAAVDIIEEYDFPDYWFAHLKMSIKLKDFLTNEIILIHQFDRLEKLSEKKVEKVPVGISTILKEELAIMVMQLAEKIK